MSATSGLHNTHSSLVWLLVISNLQREYMQIYGGAPLACVDASVTIGICYVKCTRRQRISNNIKYGARTKFIRHPRTCPVGLSARPCVAAVLAHCPRAHRERSRRGSERTNCGICERLCGQSHDGASRPCTAAIVASTLVSHA